MVNWGWLDNLDWCIVCLSLVLHISNIARVAISNIVGHNLSAAVWKSNTVFTVGGITISALVGGKVGSRVVISYSISILVHSRSNWLSLVDNRSWVVDWLVHNNWSSMVHWGWLVDNHWSWVVNWGWLGNNQWSSMVNWSMDWNMGWSMDSSASLLSSIWVVDILRGSMGLAGNNSCVRAMRLVHRVAHSWSIAVLDDLVVGLVSSGSSQKGRHSNKSLKMK